jgi:hypothetical protein
VRGARLRFLCLRYAWQIYSECEVLLQIAAFDSHLLALCVLDTLDRKSF